MSRMGIRETETGTLIYGSGTRHSSSSQIYEKPSKALLDPSAVGGKPSYPMLDAVSSALHFMFADH